MFSLLGHACTKRTRVLLEHREMEPPVFREIFLAYLIGWVLCHVLRKSLGRLQSRISTFSAQSRLF